MSNIMLQQFVLCKVALPFGQKIPESTSARCNTYKYKYSKWMTKLVKSQEDMLDCLKLVQIFSKEI